jgi:glutamate-ammonia-ligase adenylyltransferase
VRVITQAMTDLAEVTLEAAYQQGCQQLDAIHGAPMTEAGERATFWIVGMGKLGGRELNVSSDIDLIYVYDADGHTQGDTQGRGIISHHDYFAKLVKLIYNLIGEVTEHGFVFRMDLALRPNGMSGPSVISLDALEQYFQIQGREWERFAWLKSRVVAPLSSLRKASMLRDVVLPFVFRRYLDYNVFESLRQLHQQIRQHAQRQHAGRPERNNDVKLSRGGIREIEFTVQLLQVVRGGQFPELRTRSTIKALHQLVAAKLMAHETSQALGHAYEFLRRVEHRIQYLDDQQTHALPTSEADLNWIAHTMGYASSRELLMDLDRHREQVAQEFDGLLGVTPTTSTTGGCKGCGGQSTPCLSLTDLFEQLDAPLREHLQHWAQHPKISSLKEDALHRLIRLVLRTQKWVTQGNCTLSAATRWCDWLASILRRESYLAMLLERPAVHERLLRLLGAARWSARYVLQHPGVIDELASPAWMHERFDAAQFQHELEQRRQALINSGQADEENLLNLLRRAHHSEVFRTLARDVDGVLSVQAVGDDLSALADTMLNIMTQWLWLQFRQRHREDPQLAIISYGKLGGKELGYGSDLDLVFIFDDAHEQASDIYAQFVRKLIGWMTVKTAEGDLYEIDTALRPNGSSGLLVSRLDAFEQYQTQRGSNTAWTWEHQAMTRARCSMGTATLRERFDSIRHQVLCTPRDAKLLAQEIIAMRERMRQAHPVRSNHFDVKHSVGGMIDVEFVVQFLVLAHAHDHPSLGENVGNIALLLRSAECGLIEQTSAQAAADAYRDLRKIQHQARLDEQTTQLPITDVHDAQAAIERLWQNTFAPYRP